MKANNKPLSLALASLLLSEQLARPVAALRAARPASPEGDLTISEAFSDRKLQEWLKIAAHLNGAGADGVLTEEERNAVTELDLSGLGLTSLENLSAFPNLKTLDCSQNQLTALDLSGNPALERLSCGNNRLTELDLSHNPELEYLNCNFNRIARLDLTGRSKLTALYCEMNQMEELDLTGCGALLTLYCRNNQLTELDLSHSGKLEFIETFDNRLTEIDVRHLANLRFLHIDHNRLTELDMSQNRKLEGGGFVARNNFMERIHLPHQPGLMVDLDDYNEQDPIEGYDRAAWYLDEDCTQPAPEMLEARGQTLYSKRIPNRYTIYFAPNGGSGAMNAVSAQWDSALLLPANTFTRTGYTFSQWSTYPDGTSAVYGDQASVSNLAGRNTDGDRVTLYANWEANAYTIYLDPNGGQGERQTKPARYGTAVTLTNAFAPAGEDLEFAGWALSPEGPVRYPNGAAVQSLTAQQNGEVTLYAVWRTSLSGERKAFLERLEQKFQSLGSAAGEAQRYTGEDWETLSGAYAEGVGAIEAAGDTDAMERASAAAEAAMDRVPTLANRIEEVSGGWQSAHSGALQLLTAKNLTEASAAVAAAQARAALEGLDQTALAAYSGLTRQEDRAQVVGQAALRLQETAGELMTLEQAAEWLKALGGLTLRPMGEVQAEDLDAYQAALGHWAGLDEGRKAFLSAAVEDSLNQRCRLAGQKRSDAADLHSAYEGLDLSTYSPKGQAALAVALEEGLAAIRAAVSPEASQEARRAAWAQIGRVPTADQETAEPPAPPTGGGENGGNSGGAGGGTGGGGGGGAPQEPEQPVQGETVTVTDGKTGASAQVTTAADGKVTAQVTLPQGVTQATLPIPCKGGSGTVAVLVGEDGSRRVLPYAVYRDGALAVRLESSGHIELVDNSKTFSDVGGSAWYAGAVRFTASRELFSGVGGGAFAPRGTMTRAMLVTVLHRLEGSPAPSGSGAFQDVAGDTWYSAAAEWAAESGISGGTAGGTFEPGRAITREQLAVMLYRYAGSPAVAKQALNAFGDTAQVSDWARDAMAWACERGILTGDENKLLRPGDNCTRAEVSAMLERFVAQAVE